MKNRKNPTTETKDTNTKVTDNQAVAVNNQAVAVNKKTAPYILATLHRFIAGYRTCLGSVKVSLDTSTGHGLMASISSFEGKLGMAVESAMVQSLSVGDVSDIELEVDFAGLYDVPQYYSAHNPATDNDIQADGLFGLSEDVAKKLQAKITIEAESCVWKVHEEICVFLVPEVLEQM